jgi:hypothetical protein
MNLNLLENLNRWKFKFAQNLKFLELKIAHILNLLEFDKYI